MYCGQSGYFLNKPRMSCSWHGRSCWNFFLPDYFKQNWRKFHNKAPYSHHHHHHPANMILGHSLPRSGLISLFNGLPWFLLRVGYVANDSVCIPLFCLKLELYVVLLQSLCLFYNQSKCSLLFFSHISSLLLLFLLSLLLYWSNFLSLPYNTAGRVGVFYSFILVFVKVFCGLNILLIMPVIFK